MSGRLRGAGAALALAAALGSAPPLPALEGRLESLAITLPRSPDAPPPGAVRALLVARNGFLWIATDGGLARYDGARFRRFDGASEPAWTAGAATALAESADGGLWIGTAHGPRVWDGARFAAPLAGPGAASAVTALAAGADGALWIATRAGVARFAAGSARWFGAAEGLPAAVADLVVDGGGTPWAATAAGVARLDGERFRAVSSEPAHALAPAVAGVLAGVTTAAGEEVVELPAGLLVVRRGPGGATGALARRLALDRDGDLWLGGGELARRRGGSPFVDYDGSGRFGRDITALALAPDGRLWVGTAAGEVRGLGAATAAAPPVAVIDALVADGRAVALARARTPSGPDRVEIDFAAADFDRPEALAFRYRLSGYDRDWQGPTRERRVAYTRLPPGGYRFEVAGSRDGARWSAPATLAFAVAPRWFETLAARLAAALAAVVALVAADRWRLRRLRRREHELRHLVAVSTAELRAINETLEQRVAAQTGEIRATRDMAVLTLARLAELRDGTTGEHLERIASYARRLAVAAAAGPLGPLTPEFIDEIYRSSPLHDIGKVAIPDAILRKAGPLDAEERRIMEAHTTVGGDTLRQVIERSPAHSFLAMAMEIAYHHHERWDGEGYPAGLAGEAIALPARIVAVVDAYDALTSARPYKPALPHEEAIRRIRADSGRHFDPRLVAALEGIAGEIDAIRGAHPSAAGG